MIDFVDGCAILPNTRLGPGHGMPQGSPSRDKLLFMPESRIKVIGPMDNTSAQQSNAKFVRSTILVVATHAVAPVLWLVIMLFVVPRFAALLNDMTDGETRLPLLTQLILNCSVFFARHWYMYPILLSPALVIDATVYYLLARHMHKALARTWSLLILLAQLAITILVIGALILSVYQMTSSLAG